MGNVRKFLLFLGDIVILYLSLSFTMFVRYGNRATEQHILAIHILPFSILFAIWVLVSYIANLYDFSIAKNNIDFYSQLLYTFIANTLIAVLFFYFIPFFGITPKTNLFIFLGFASTMTVAWRYYFNTVLARTGFKNHILIIGRNQQSEELATLINGNPQLGYRVTEIISTEQALDTAHLVAAIQQRKIKRIILSTSAYKTPEHIDALFALLRKNVEFITLSDFFERLTGKVPLDAIDQIWFLENLSGYQKRFYEMIKRTIDFILATLIGLITIPFSLLVMLAIKLDSAGPIFYRQIRIGQDGKLFTVVKLRTMFQDSEQKTGAVWPAENDARTTRIGRFLRRSRIDELPQIWNVIRGDMSFVGPRPERPEFLNNLKQEIPFYEERYLVKPGLTGWAQIKFKLDFRGGLTVHDTKQKLKYDLYYIKHRSFLFDLGIMLKTINIILKKLTG